MERNKTCVEKKTEMSSAQQALVLIQQQQLEKQRGLVEFAQAFIPVIMVDHPIPKLFIGSFLLAFSRFAISANSVAALYFNGERVCECTRVCLRLDSNYAEMCQVTGNGHFRIWVMKHKENSSVAEIGITRSNGTSTKACFPMVHQAKVVEFFKAMCKTFNWEIKQD